MRDLMIEKTIDINAPASKVWEVLVHPDWLKRWASAFSEGTYAESDWEPGSEVLWKDKEGSTGAKGKVVANEPFKLLKVAFYDDVHADSGDALGRYSETYNLIQTDGKTTFSIVAGPLPEEHFRLHDPLWEQAMEKIKFLGEEAMMVSGMDA